MPSEEKSITKSTIIEELKCFYDKMKITDHCTFSVAGYEI
jgi:hypothetical protein